MNNSTSSNQQAGKEENKEIDELLDMMREECKKQFPEEGGWANNWLKVGWNACLQHLKPHLIASLPQSNNKEIRSVSEVLKASFNKHVKHISDMTFEEVEGGTGYNWIYEAMHEYHNQFHNKEEVNEDEFWISVEEELPRNNEQVLCLIRDFNKMRQDSYSEGADQDKEWFKNRFSHWMPLPKLPHSIIKK